MKNVTQKDIWNCREAHKSLIGSYDSTNDRVPVIVNNSGNQTCLGVQFWNASNLEQTICNEKDGSTSEFIEFLNNGNNPITPEQAAIIKPEWEKMQDFLNPKPIPPLNTVYVKFENEAFNYSTSVSAATTETSARAYFVGTSFNVDAYPSETTAKCIDIEFINNQKI